MATISDPADGQFQAPIATADTKAAARLDALVALYTRPEWRHASATKTGEPALLAHEVLRLRAALAELTTIRDALRAVGVYRSDEAGDDGSEWCVTLEPQGDRLAGTLEEALRAVSQASYNDGWREGREDMASADAERAAMLTGPTDPDRPDLTNALPTRGPLVLWEHEDGYCYAWGRIPDEEGVPDAGPFATPEEALAHAALASA